LDHPADLPDMRGASAETMSGPFASYEGRRPLGNVSTVLRLVAADKARGVANVPCAGCNACCKSGYKVDLTPEEAGRLPHVLDNDGVPILPRRGDGSCALLKDEKCSVYEKRPVSCRKYDCRAMGLTGIATNELLRAGFVPWGVYANGWDEVDMLIALRMAGKDALDAQSGGGSPELKAALRAAVAMVGEQVDGWLAEYANGGAEEAARAACLLWPMYLEHAKRVRQVRAANPALRADLEQPLRRPRG
jgi:Fe-S-cluster containining protein